MHGKSFHFFTVASLIKFDENPISGSAHFAGNVVALLSSRSRKFESFGSKLYFFPFFRDTIFVKKVLAYTLGSLYIILGSNQRNSWLDLIYLE